MIKYYLTGSRFGQKWYLEGCDFDRARSLIRKIEDAETFDDLYGILGFRYVLDPAGLMESLPRDTFRLAIRAGVPEHIPATTAQQIRVEHGLLVGEGRSQNPRHQHQRPPLHVRQLREPPTIPDVFRVSMEALV